MRHRPRIDQDSIYLVRTYPAKLIDLPTRRQSARTAPESVGQIAAKAEALRPRRAHPTELACWCIHCRKHIPTLLSLGPHRWSSDAIRAVCTNSGAAQTY